MAGNNPKESGRTTRNHYWELLHEKDRVSAELAKTLSEIVELKATLEKKVKHQENLSEKLQMLIVLDMEMHSTESSLEKHKQRYLKHVENFDKERAQQEERLEKILASEKYINQAEQDKVWQPTIFQVAGSYREGPSEEPIPSSSSEEPSSDGSPEVLIVGGSSGDQGSTGPIEKSAPADSSREQAHVGNLDQPASACVSEAPVPAAPSGRQAVAGSSKEPSPGPSDPAAQKEKPCFFCKGFHIGCDCLVITYPNRKRNRYDFDSSDDEENSHSQQPQGAMARQPTVRNGWPASKIKKHLLDHLTEYQYGVLVNQALGKYGPKATVQLEKQSVSEAEMALAMRDLELERRKKYKIPLKKYQNPEKENEKEKQRK